MRHYYTYQDLMTLLSCSKRTVQRKLKGLNIRKRYFNGGKPYFLIKDVHAIIEFNKSFQQCNQQQRDWIVELLNNE